MAVFSRSKITFAYVLSWDSQRSENYTLYILRSHITEGKIDMSARKQSCSYPLSLFIPLFIHLDHI